MDEIDQAAKVLEIHQIEWISPADGYACGCDDRGLLDQMPTLSDALKHQAAEVLKALGRNPEVEGPWNDAIDWLLNSRHTGDPNIQKAFWGIVDGKYTRDQADQL